MKIVVYTAIIGEYDNLEDPRYINTDIDYVCFTTNPNLKSDIWQIRRVLPLYKDNTRTARMYKVLPHKYLNEYDVSIWVDGNMKIMWDMHELVDQLKGNMGCFDHMQCFDKRNCIYQEAEAIFQLGDNNMKRKPEKGLANYKDNPSVIKDQIDRYKTLGYPSDNGLIFSAAIVRKHNEADCIKCMNKWWNEINYGSKRDQLSFNFAAWITDFKFSYFPGDLRDCKYFKMAKHNKHKKNEKEVSNGSISN